MPKHNRKGFRALKVDFENTLLTLADEAYVGADLSTTVDRTVYLFNLKVTAALRGLTAGEGPLHLIVAHSNYNDTQVIEWFQSVGSWDSGDMISNERARRKCRLIATFSGNETEEVPNDGLPISVKLGFPVQDGETLQFGMYNESTATLTTGASIMIKGFAFGRNA